MPFLTLTRDDKPLIVNTDMIVSITPLPGGKGSRITFAAPSDRVPYARGVAENPDQILKMIQRR